MAVAEEDALCTGCLLVITMISWMSRSTQAQTYTLPADFLITGLRMIGKGPGDVKRELVKVSRHNNLLIFFLKLADWLISTTRIVPGFLAVT